MTDHAAPADKDLEDLHEHHAPGGLGKYIAVFVALCVLTAISFTVGNWESLRKDAPTVMWATMMAVSCAKAMLVILFFMHLQWEANWKYVLTIPASLMSVFLLLMLIPDIGRRVEKYASERWLHAPVPHFHDAHAGSRGSGEAGHDSPDHAGHDHEAGPAGGTANH